MSDYEKCTDQWTRRYLICAYMETQTVVKGIPLQRMLSH
jgi:hypothetical protein